MPNHELSPEQIEEIRKAAEESFNKPVRNVTSDGRVFLGKDILNPHGGQKQALTDDEVREEVMLAAEIPELAHEDLLYPLFLKQLPRVAKRYKRGHWAFDPVEEAPEVWFDLAKKLIKTRARSMNRQGEQVVSQRPLEDLLSLVTELSHSGDRLQGWEGGNEVNLKYESFIKTPVPITRPFTVGSMPDVKFPALDICPSPQIGRAWVNTALSVFRRAKSEGVLDKYKS